MWTNHLRPKEEQRPIAGWPGYYVTSEGRVFSYKVQGRHMATVNLNASPKELLQTTLKLRGSREDYFVNLREGRDNRRLIRVAKLVAEAFIGPRPKGKLVLHWDDIQSNNRVDNLRYGTHQENRDDAVRNNRVPNGEKHCKAKLNNAQVIEIRSSTLSTNALAAKFGVNRNIIECVKRGETYRKAGQ